MKATLTLQDPQGNRGGHVKTGEHPWFHPDSPGEERGTSLGSRPPHKSTPQHAVAFGNSCGYPQHAEVQQITSYYLVISPAKAKALLLKG